MAQMAPALVEAAGSPSPNADISSSAIPDSLRISNVEEAIKQENSRLHMNSASLNHNGVCRSLANGRSATKPVSCVMEKVNMLNKFPHTRQKALESIVCSKANTQLPCPSSPVEKTGERGKIHSQLSQKETLVSTPTRIPPITTTKTCAANSQQSLSSCGDSVAKTNDEIEQRHSVARTDSSPQALFDKKVSKIACSKTRLAARARKLERKLRILQKRQLESHVSEQLASSCVTRRNSQTTRLDNLLIEKADQKKSMNVHGPASHIVKEEENSLGKREKKSVAQENKIDSRKSLKDDTKLDCQLKISLETESKPPSTPGFAKGENDVARSLVCQLELVEVVGDSDATQSSSGGESCDEMDEDNLNVETKRLTSYLNKFHSDRGNIASRWAWLRSQVVDVERRIRRCEETYKSVRLRKGAVQLGKQKVVVENRMAVSVANKSAEDFLADTVNIINSMKEPHNFNNSMRKVTPRPEVSISRNSNSLLTEGLKETTNSIINNGKSNIHLTDHINSCTAARTRPVQYWQKRKLFSLPQLQKPNQTVLCACSSPLTPCVLCKRNSKNLPVLKPKQSMKERVSLLDLSFHPVLSFDTDVPLSLHFGALLKKGKFQSKICKLSPPKITKVPTKRKYVRSASSPAAVKKGRKESLDLSYRKQGIRTLRKRKKSVSLPNTPKTTSNQRLCKTEVANKKRPAAVNAIAGIRLASQLKKRARSLSLPSTNSRPSSPVSSSVSPTSLGHSFPGSALAAKRKKPTSNAFDINNIVIPYSMASTTRVEKLKYKEIMTPAWRELVVTPKESTATPDVKDDEDNCEIEELSNLTFALRHMKCEEQERKRFLGMAIKKKKRATRQSSEATTPEPVSPGSLLINGSLSAGQMSSGLPSPSSSNPPSLNSCVNVISPTGLAETLPLVNMLPQDSLLAKFDQSGKSTKQDSRRTPSLDQSEDSNDVWPWPVVTPWVLRDFPLSEKDQEALKNTHSPPTPRCPSSVPPSPSSSRGDSPILSPVDSPDSATNSNWTVKVLSPEIEDNLESDSKPSRKGIVLKLAKR